MNTRSLVSIEDYTKEEILEVLKSASEFEANPNQRLLEGKVVASLFFEPSTRTRLSFETAINRLGGRIIGFSDAGFFIIIFSYREKDLNTEYQLTIL